MPEFDVLTLADLNVDLVLADADPEFGQKEKLISGYLLEVGGSCPIFACQAAKLGLRTAVAGVIGADLFGRFMIARLSECGVDVSEVEIIDGLRTAASFALCRGNDRAILTDAAGITAMSPERANVKLLKRARHLHVGSNFLLTNLQPHFPRIVKLAKSLGLTISLDTNWDPTEKWKGINEILEFTDVFLPNENEILAITGMPNLETAMAKAAQIVPQVVVKRGSQGAIACCGNQTWTVPAYQVDYIDGVGAGDSFDAGFLKGYLNGFTVEESLRLGSYCGALNTTAPGGIQGQPYWGALPPELLKK
jgi:sugar/nucleoside kinase (ribokinase family)